MWFDGRVRVRLFLDVDGVINALSPTDRWDDLTHSRVDGFPIYWSPTVVRFLNELSSQVEILWLTSWEESAPNLLAPSLGLRPFGLAGRQTGAPRAGWWKHGWVESHWARDPKPFIWIDDELGYFSSVQNWLGELPINQALAISPDTSDGLCPDHLDQILGFLSLHGGTALSGDTLLL
jgi:HAD domain in Swiss Army Knife RNA repair proteins